jgi:hypothetical protein
MSNEELIAFVKKNPVGIGCGLLSLALGGFIYFRSGQIPESEAELVQKSSEGQRLASNLNNANQLQEHHDALVAANKAIDARLARASQFAKNLQYFYKIESETGVKLTTDPRISPPAVKKDAKAAFIALPCSLSVQGTLPQLLVFLRRLENGTHYCRVLTFSLAGSADRNGPLNLSVNLELLGLP